MPSFDIILMQQQYEIKNALEKYDKDFFRPLSQRVGNLDNYSKKLFENAVCLGAYVDEMLVGFIAFYMNDLKTGQAYLSQVVVNAKFRKKGVGTILLNSMENRIIEKGKFNSIALEVDKKNQSAVNFYIRHGYKFCNSTENSYYMRKGIWYV